FPSVVKEDLVVSRVLFPFSCEGRPGGVSRVVLFPSDSPEASSDESDSVGDNENEEAMLSRRLQRILAKKKKFQSGRRDLKKNKDFKRSDGKDVKKGEPICYECKKPRHIKAECPKIKKPEFRKKDSSKKFKKYKKKAMAAAWENSSDSNSESSSCSDEEEANLAFMANIEDKADSDLMFWAIQNREINMAEVMIERMKFAREQIWDTKSKLNVSLPYAHLLTKVFKHFGVDLSGAVTEKMGQAIRSRNLKKSGFSLQNGTWSKASVAEGEAIIGDFPDVQEEAVEPAAEQPVVVQSTAVEASVAIEPAAPSAPELAGSPLIEAPVEEAMASAVDPLPTSIVASILKEVLDSIHSTPVTPEAGGESVAEVVASGHIEESLAIPVQEEQSDAPDNIILEEDAPIQGEQEPMEKDAPVQGEQSKESPIEATRSDEPMGSVPADENLPNAPNDARDGETASSSDSDDDQPPPASEARHKGKEVESEVPLLSNTPFERQMSQASASKEISNIRNAMKWFNKEMGSMKNMLSEILKVVGAQAPPPPPPAAQVQESGPSGPAPAVAAAEVNVQGFPEPAEQVSGPTGPLESEPVQTEVEEEEDLVVSRVLFPFSCEGRPGGVSRVVLFPSGVKEDQPSWVL
ncbi:hypothetical protein Taro_023096, partial [Colocasia esculenta]|nr:hypothetical protein [Colocasia esculenta]